jgi:hypothetical protein
MSLFAAMRYILMKIPGLARAGSQRIERHSGTVSGLAILLDATATVGRQRRATSDAVIEGLGREQQPVPARAHRMEDLGPILRTILWLASAPRAPEGEAPHEPLLVMEELRQRHARR